MNSELTNLLPDERVNGLRRTYFMRLASVTVGMVIVLTVITGVLLLPTYVYLQSEIQTRTATLNQIEKSLASADQVALESRLSLLTSETNTLAALASVPSASVVMNNILTVPRTGITLSGFNYTPAQTGKPGQLVLNGIAASRDDLRAYQLALQGSSLVSRADLPISAYANDTNISFTITLTLSTSS